MGRGQPVGPSLATSSDGGGIAADSIAARPVQVLVALRPCVLQRDHPVREWPQRCMSLMPVPSGEFPLGHVPEVSAL
jgi:hypothetical protein